MAIPKILFIDIETAPILAYVWGIWDQNVGLNQINTDWHILAWSAKWLDSEKIMYRDQRHAKSLENDKGLLEEVWNLLDEADIVVTQNGKKFDQKKLNTRFLIHGFSPPSHFQHIDTLQIARKYFGFTSNKLAYMTDKLCTKYKKLEHAEFPGFELWRECMDGNLKAWKEMERYNKMDVLSLEELYLKLRPWDNSVNLNLYSDDANPTRCQCGGAEFQSRGYRYTAVAKYRQFRCKKCGATSRGRQNLLSKEKRNSLLVKG